MILATITPNNYLMPFEAVKCWWGMSYPVVFAQGPDLDYNRNAVWKQVQGRYTHLLMIDSDLVFTTEDIVKIENHLNSGLDAVCGIYPVGQPPYPPCIYERIPGDYKLTSVKPGLNEIGACGGGFLGINKEVINKLPNNPFDNIREGDIFHGEDISFCHRLHKHGFKLWADSSIRLGHVRNLVIYDK